jgi:hypothetical protein
MPQAAIGTLVDINLAAEDGVLFGHRYLLFIFLFEVANVETV